MKLYSIYTDETKRLKDIFLKSIKDDWEINISYWGKIGEGKGNFGTPGYVNLIRKRVEYLINIIKKNWGDVIIWSDIDIQFFGKCEDLIKQAIMNKDIVFLSENWPSKYVNGGFAVMRCNSKILSFYESVFQENLEELPQHDQTVVNDILKDTTDIKWDILPWQFWAMSHEHNPPKDIVLHHANATFPCFENGKIKGSMEIKLAQIKRLRRYILAKRFIPNQLLFGLSSFPILKIPSEIHNKKNLLATLADTNYLDQAKQLFSSVYLNAGWKGDCMLLAYGLSDKELAWFTEKGILVKKCEPVFNRKVGASPQVSQTGHARLYLFTPEFKRWNNVVYLDADIIVRWPIDELTTVKSFAAARIYNPTVPTLKTQFVYETEENRELFCNITSRYNLKKVAFNSGVLAFNTEVIEANTFSELESLGRDFADIIWLGDETILNMYFYNKWQELSAVYNFCPSYEMFLRGCNIDELKELILHNYSLYRKDTRPWIPDSPFYPEWKSNLEKAESVDFIKPVSSKKILTKKSAARDGIYLKRLHKRYLRKIAFDRYVDKYNRNIDRYIGKVGIFLKRHLPWIYHYLKKQKMR